VAIDVDPRGREYPLPDPLAAGVRALAGQGPGEFHPAGSVLEVALVLSLDRIEMGGEIRPHHTREHGHPVLVTLAAPDDDLVSREIDILHPEAGALEQPEAGAVEQQGHEARRAHEAANDGPDLTTGEDDGKALGTLGPDDIGEPGHLLLEHLAIEEKDSAQRLVLGRRRHVPLDGQRAEKRRDLGSTHLGGVALAVEEDVPADPPHVGLLGAAAVGAGADGIADAVEKPRRAGLQRLRLAHSGGRGGDRPVPYGEDSVGHGESRENTAARGAAASVLKSCHRRRCEWIGPKPARWVAWARCHSKPRAAHYGRSVADIFAVGSFTDEIAALARLDPVEFRLERLRNPRGIEVLQRATACMGWYLRLSPSPDGRPRRSSPRPTSLRQKRVGSTQCTLSTQPIGVDSRAAGSAGRYRSRSPELAAE